MIVCVTGQSNPYLSSLKAKIMSEIYFGVKPGQKQFKVESDTIIQVSLTEKAENGRANQQLKQKIEEITGEEPGIISGHKSRRKKLVFNQEEDQIRRKLKEAKTKNG